MELHSRNWINQYASAAVDILYIIGTNPEFIEIRGSGSSRPKIKTEIDQFSLRKLTP